MEVIGIFSANLAIYALTDCCYGFGVVFSSSISGEQWEEWVNANATGRHVLDIQTYSRSFKLLGFYDSVDAVAFKMRWG